VAYGEEVTLDASASSDPDGVVVEAEWDLGDGTLATGAVTQRVFATPGTYWVRLTVRDDDGAPATAVGALDVGVTSVCTPAPRAGCAAAERASITIRDSGVPARRSLGWKWKRGPVAAADLGDPRTTTEVALCVYHADGLALATAVRPGAAWTALAAGGFRLRGAGTSPGGLRGARLRAGAGLGGSLSVKAAGEALPVPSLPLALPVTVQLVAGDTGACWQASHAAATQNGATLFKAR
jgi:hypothetical protein